MEIIKATKNRYFKRFHYKPVKIKNGLLYRIEIMMYKHVGYHIAQFNNAPKYKKIKTKTVTIIKSD